MNAFPSIALAFAIVAPGSADDWSMYLRNAAHTSFNASESQLDKTNVASLTPVWTYSKPGWLIASAVTVSQGVAYFGDWKGYFHAVRADDGTELWSQYVGLSEPGETMECSGALGVTSQSMLAGDVVYVGGGDSAVYALDRNSGQQLWGPPLADSQSGSYLWSSIMVSQNALYLGVASLADCPLVRGGIVRISLDAPDQPLIRYLVPEDELGGGVWSTPAIDVASNTVFVTTGTGDQDAARGAWGGTLLALDATTLDIKAYYFLPTNSLLDDIEWGSSPTLFETADGTRLVGATGKDGYLYALSRDDLSLVWTTRLAVSCLCPECGCGSLSTPSFDGNMLYVGAGVDDPEGTDSGSIYAIAPSTGEVVWKNGLDGTVIAPTTVANGVVYAASLTGLLAFEAQTGELLWRDGTQTISYAQPVVVDGVLYSTYLKGNVVAWQVAARGGSSARPGRLR